MKHTLLCWRCSSKIAGFDELKMPLTVDQFKHWHPDMTLEATFGGEKQNWETMRCTSCRILLFMPIPGQGVLERTHPTQVRIDSTGDPAKDYYQIPGAGEFKCPYEDCGFATNHKSSLNRHIRTQHKGKQNG